MLNEIYQTIQSRKLINSEELKPGKRIAVLEEGYLDIMNVERVGSLYPGRIAALRYALDRHQ